MGINARFAIKRFLLESYPDVIGFRSVKLYALGFLIFIGLMCIWGYAYEKQDDTNDFVTDFNYLALPLMIIVVLLILPTVFRSRLFTQWPSLWPVRKSDKVASHYWMLAFIIPLLYNLPSFFLTWMIVAGNDERAVSVSTTDTYIIDIIWDTTVILYVLFILVATLSEEYCFSGFLGPELLKRFSGIKHASMLTGITNELWYKPLFIATWYISSDVDWVDLASCINLILLRVILMILMIKSGSMLVPWAMHFWHYLLNGFLCSITIYTDDWVLVVNGIGLGGYGSLICGLILWALLYRYELNKIDPEIGVVAPGGNSTPGIMMRISNYVPKDQDTPIVKV